jgi:hypothetical protein
MSQMPTAVRIDQSITVSGRVTDSDWNENSISVYVVPDENAVLKVLMRSGLGRDAPFSVTVSARAMSLGVGEHTVTFYAIDTTGTISVGVSQSLFVIAPTPTASPLPTRTRSATPLATAYPHVIMTAPSWGSGSFRLAGTRSDTSRVS